MSDAVFIAMYVGLIASVPAGVLAGWAIASWRDKRRR